jgi:NADH-quinone oxidoreductase subunit G
MAKIEIDGKEIEAQDGASIIEVADANEVYIPRFCFHKKLKVAASCRMCLVEVEKAPKAMPACATPVMEGMKISTKSEKTMKAQKAVMEFLLINHPLDCPICDQGGQCELQDLAMGYGADVSTFRERKNTVVDENLGPFIATDMTRCIHCTRCVRFGEEIAGMRELGVEGRGEQVRIGTYVKKMIKSEMSGNVIDLCPVGALTSKPFRYKARAWELKQAPGVAMHDCVGSNIYFNQLRGDILRVNPRENEAINEVWISDRDRFSYSALQSDHRALLPMVKKKGEWQTVSWEKAFEETCYKLQKALGKEGDQLGALVSPNASIEEMYLLQKLCRGVGTNHIDHRLRQTDFDDQDAMPLSPGLSGSVADIGDQQTIFLVGSDLRQAQPILAWKCRKAQLAGARLFAINPYRVDYNFTLERNCTINLNAMPKVLGKLLKAALKVSGKTHALSSQVEKLDDCSQAANLASALIDAEKAAIIVGTMAMHHPNASEIRALCHAIADVTGASVNALTDGANARGAWLSGCVPHRGAMGATLETSGLDAQAMLKAKLNAYLLQGLEPGLDCANSFLAKEALAQADCVIAMSAFVTDELKAVADVILPIASLGETAGTFVNAAGVWQSFAGVVPPKGEARPAWKVLRVLANFLKIKDFDYTSPQDVLAALKAEEKPFDNTYDYQPASITQPDNSLMRVGPVPLYRADMLARFAPALQARFDMDDCGGVGISQATADSLGVRADQNIQLKQQGAVMSLPVRIDPRVPDNSFMIASALAETVGLGNAFGDIEVVGTR